MSSHREAPEISKDPVADSTDVYAFVSPDRPDTVTIITNYIPLEDPAGGPNFFEFGDDVLYPINIDNDSDGRPEIVYEFRFTTTNTNPDSFLYNTGPIDTLDSPNFNRRQTYDVTEVRRGGAGGWATACRPRRATSGSARRRTTRRSPTPAIHDIGGGIKVFAGQRLDGFFVDLGSVFDLGALRPFQHLHLIPTPQAPGVNALRAFNVHTLAIQVPITRLTASGKRPKDVMAAGRDDRRLGVGVAPQGDAARRRAASSASVRSSRSPGSATRCSTRSSCRWAQGRVERAAADRDADFAQYVAQPELADAAAGPVPGRVPEPGRARPPTAPTCWRSC